MSALRADVGDTFGRLQEAIEGERRFWMRVEVAPDDLAMLLDYVAASFATSAAVPETPTGQAGPWLDDIIRALTLGVERWDAAHEMPGPSAGTGSSRVRGWTFYGADGPFHELVGSTLRRLLDFRAALAQPPAPVSAEADAAWLAFVDDIFEAVDADSAVMLAEAVAKHRPAIEAAIRGTTAGTPLDADDILPQLPDDASLSQQFRAGWYAARQALAAAREPVAPAEAAEAGERWVVSGPVIDEGDIHAHELTTVVIDGPVGEACRLCREQVVAAADLERFARRFHRGTRPADRSGSPR